MAVVAEILKRICQNGLECQKARKPTLKELGIYEFGLLIKESDVVGVYTFIIFSELC